MAEKSNLEKFRDWAKNKNTKKALKNASDYSAGFVNNMSDVLGAGSFGNFGPEPAGKKKKRRPQGPGYMDGLDMDDIL